MQEARKSVPSDEGAPSTDQAVINIGFFLTRPDWDFNMPEDKGHLKVYCQAPLSGLKEAAQQHINLINVWRLSRNQMSCPQSF